MKKPFLSLAALCALLLSVVPAGQAAPTSYQVTGPIVSMTDTMIVVKKSDKENFEIAKDAALKADDGSELKVGDKVTVYYTMSAKSIEAKKPKAAAKPKAGAKAAASPAASPAAAPSASPAAQ